MRRYFSRISLFLQTNETAVAIAIVTSRYSGLPDLEMQVPDIRAWFLDLSISVALRSFVRNSGSSIQD